METVEIELFVKVDEYGDWQIGVDKDEADERYSDDIGGTGASRHVRVVLEVPLPQPNVVTVRGKVPNAVSKDSEPALLSAE